MQGRFRHLVAKRPRLTGFAILSAVLLAVVYYLAPQQLGVTLHKFSIVTLGGVVGYWLHRHAFPFEVSGLLDACQTDARVVPLVNSAVLSRAIIMAAAMVAAGIAL